MTMRQAAAELSAVADTFEEASLTPVVEALVAARRVMLYGCGREGLMMRALAMRLHHLGLEVGHAGRHGGLPARPGRPVPLRRRARLAVHGSALCRVARAAGARVLVVTAEPEGETARMADDLLVIPAQTMASDVGGASVLPMGSLFEGAMFLAFEVLVLELRAALGETAETMRARHTNME